MASVIDLRKQRRFQERKARNKTHKSYVACVQCLCYYSEAATSVAFTRDMGSAGNALYHLPPASPTLDRVPVTAKQMGAYKPHRSFIRVVVARC